MGFCIYCRWHDGTCTRMEGEYGGEVFEGTLAYANDGESYTASVFIVEPEKMGCTMFQPKDTE